LSSTPIIEAEKLTKDFNGFVAVDHISFTVKSGEIFGFLGPNGAGKTTTVRMLCALTRPTAGSARIAGCDVRTEQDKVRRAIGIIFQDPSLDDRLTARENLRFHGLIYKVPGSEINKRIQEGLEWMELAERSNEGETNLILQYKNLFGSSFVFAPDADKIDAGRQVRGFH